MGHYDAAGEQSTMAETTVFGSFKDHFSSSRSHTGLAVIESLRKLYPDQHITQINAASCGLIKFAVAGLADATLIRKDDQYLATRTYAPLKSRMEGGDGRLGRSVTFGFYEYAWGGKDFQVYDISWPTDRGCPDNYSYVLTPKADEDTHGNSPAVDALIKAAGKWSSELHEEIYVFDSGRWVKDHRLWSSVRSASWDDVILDPAMKDTLIKDVESFFDSRSVYEEYSVPWKRGIIFHGAPGCGKTISIKALMNTLEAKSVASLYVKSFRAQQGMEYSIRAIFQQARIMAPCMLIFEDLDSLVVDEVRSYFLNEVDGLEDNNGILMIGSSNHLEQLDPAISKRPSRFDRKYNYKLPGARERVMYCQYWRRKLQKRSEIDFNEDICDVVSQITDGFSFAYLKELFVQTLLTIVGGPEDDEDFEEVTISDAAEQAKVVDGSASLLMGEETVQSTAEEGAADAKSKPTMPDVEVPEHLQSNPLMRILLKQTKALWKEMDNTTDEVHSRAKVGGQGMSVNRKKMLVKRAVPAQ